MWKAVYYRLMVRYPSGRVVEYAHGSLAYLFRLSTQRRRHGDAWVELNTEPAVLIHSKKM